MVIAAVEAIEAEKLGHVLLEVKPFSGDVPARLPEATPQVGVMRERQDTISDLVGGASRHEKAGLSILNQLRNAADLSGDDRTSTGHCFGNREAEHFLPSGHLADNVSGGIYAFSQWILNEPSPREVLLYLHRRSEGNVFFARSSVHDHHKLHLWNLAEDESSCLEHVGNSLFGNEPAHLCDDRTTVGDPVLSAELDTRVGVLPTTACVNAIVDEVESILRQYL